MSSRPLDISRSSPGTSAAAGSPAPSSPSRQVSIARLSSPVPSHLRPNEPSVQQIPTPDQLAADKKVHPSKIEDQSSLPAAGPSALTAALASGYGHHSPRFGTPPTTTTLITQIHAGLGSHDRIGRSNYGSFNSRDVAGSPAALEDPEVVKRYLVQPDQGT